MKNTVTLLACLFLSVSNIAVASSPVLPQASVLALQPPQYPVIARQAAITGIVNVAVTVDDSGSVVDATAKDGPMMLRDAAISNVRTWKFNSKAFSFRRVSKKTKTLTIMFEYRLEGKPESDSGSTVILDIPKRVTVIARPALMEP